jgi:polysaccharide deacetylase 2 family uncharacterized protein YibQ
MKVWVVTTRRQILIALVALLVLVSTAVVVLARAGHTTTIAPTPCYVALIIDDWGNNGDGIAELLEVDIPITAAVMPFCPYTRNDADLAHNAGFEVILHLPMQATNGHSSWLGPRPITTDLTNEEIRQRVNDACDDVRWAVGINNHMGLIAMQDHRVMREIMTVAKERNLCFIDSVTCYNSAVAEVAEEVGVTHYKRNVFLESRGRSLATVEKQLLKLIDYAQRRGYAIGIGHVGTEGGRTTVQAIKNMAPIMQERGVKFIFISQIKDVVADLERQKQNQQPDPGPQ